MTFDYRHFFVISLLVLLVTMETECQDEYVESDARIQRLEEFITNEILTYLRLLRIENEKKLKILGQDAENGGQQYYTSQYDNTNWLQNSPDLFYSQQFPSWQGGFGANPINEETSQFWDYLTSNGRPKIPSNSVIDGRGLGNGILPSSYDGMNSFNGYPLSMQKLNLPLPYAKNRIMQLPRFSDDQLRNTVPLFFTEEYDENFNQMPKNGMRVGGRLGGPLSDGRYKFLSDAKETISAAPISSSTSVGKKPPYNAIGNGNTGSIVRPPKKSGVKSSNVVGSSHGSTDVDINAEKLMKNLPETGSSSVNFGTGSSAAVKLQENGSNGSIVRDTSSGMAGAGIKPANKKYKVLIVDGESAFADGVNFDEMHKKLFSTEGGGESAGSTAAAKTKVMEETSNSGGQPLRTFQTTSLSNIGLQTKTGTNLVSFQGGISGEDTMATATEEIQPRELGSHYTLSSGFGNFNPVKIMPTNGFQKMHHLN